MDDVTGQAMRVGDVVVADERDGIIVCDLDRREFAPGWEGWDMPRVGERGGGTLSSGVMVLMAEAGPIHYGEADAIDLVSRGMESPARA